MPEIMAGAFPHIQVLIPVHNRCALTRRALDALAGDAAEGVSVTVIDDGSTDDTARMLRENYPWVRVVRGDGNLWWTGGVLAGVNSVLAELRQGDYVMLLNNDVTIRSGFFTAMRLAAARLPGYALSPVAISDEGHRLSVGVDFFWKQNKISISHTGLELDARCPVPGEVEADALFGRATLLPAEIFLSGVTFDARAFPHYWGDVDLCLRARHLVKGHRILTGTEVSVREAPGSTGIHLDRNPGFLRALQKLVSRRSALNIFYTTRFFLRHAPRGRKMMLLKSVLRDHLRDVILATKNGGRILRIWGRLFPGTVHAGEPSAAEPLGLDGCRVTAIIPTFQRRSITLQCLKALKAQSRPPDQIIVVDGGSRDGTREAIAAEHPDVTVLTPKDAWWGQAMAIGIAHLMRACPHPRPTDYLLMVNDDSTFSHDYVETVLAVSRRTGGAVSGIVVDADHPEKIIDSGEYICWENYEFPVMTDLPKDSIRDDVNFLPARGTILPLSIVSVVGNIDKAAFPHYFADYDFFYRVRKNGYRLVVTSDVRVCCMTGSTGIAAGHSTAVGLRKLLAINLSRRSQSNIFIHARFMWRHAPCRTMALRLFLQMMAYRVWTLAKAAKQKIIPNRGTRQA